MNIILVDTNIEVVNAWSKYFGDYENVKIIHGDIVRVIEENKEAYIVSPTNSFGDLQGGVDLVYFNHFGYKLEEDLRVKIIKEKRGELIVGDFLLLNKMIFVPTMRVPTNISATVNVYLAFRAVLICMENKGTIICPGMGTGVGKVSADQCALQMHQAYFESLNPRSHYDLIQMCYEHNNMILRI